MKLRELTLEKKTMGALDFCLVYLAVLAGAWVLNAWAENQ